VDGSLRKATAGTVDCIIELCLPAGYADMSSATLRSCGWRPLGSPLPPPESPGRPTTSALRAQSRTSLVRLPPGAEVRGRGLVGPRSRLNAFSSAW